jgi:hypothetical protein
MRQLFATQRPDRRRMLQSGATRGRRCLLEFKLSGRADADSSEQFLLQQRPGLYRRGWRTGLLQRPARQRRLPDTDAAADIDLRNRLRAGR